MFYKYFTIVFHYRVFGYDLTDAISSYVSRKGIFHRVDMTAYIRLDLGIFKGKIRVHHLAVHKTQTLAVAERLRSLNAAIYESKILGIPAEVFSVYLAIRYGNVF